MGVEDHCLNKQHSSVAFWTPKGKQGMAEDYIYGHDICSQGYCLLLCGYCKVGMIVLFAFSSLLSVPGNRDERNTSSYKVTGVTLRSIDVFQAPIPQLLGVSLLMAYTCPFSA